MSGQVNPFGKLPRIEGSVDNIYDNPPLEKPPAGAPKPLDPATKKSWGEKFAAKGSAVLKGLGKEYVKSFEMMGDILVGAAEIDAPKSASAKHIGKFAAHVAACPFRVGMALLINANILLGMVLATPIIAVAKAFPEETKILFHAKITLRQPPHPTIYQK